MGSSWEGFALEQVLRQIRPTQAYFRGRPGTVQATLAPGVEGWGIEAFAGSARE